MSDDPVELDTRRGIAARKATEMRREKLSGFRTQQAALGRRQRELEALLQAAPAESWPDVVAKAQYLIQLFAASPEGQDPRRKLLIARTLEELNRFCERSENEQ